MTLKKIETNLKKLVKPKAKPKKSDWDVFNYLKNNLTINDKTIHLLDPEGKAHIIGMKK